MRHSEKDYKVKASLGNLIFDISWSVDYKLDDKVSFKAKKYIEAFYQIQIS